MAVRLTGDGRREPEAAGSPYNGISCRVRYAVTYEGVRIGTVEQQPQGSRLTRWLARSAITNETASFPTRRQASTWLTAPYLAQRNRARNATRTRP
jgi:hypothetical protein